MFALVSSQLRRGRGGQLLRSFAVLAGSFQQQPQCCAAQPSRSPPHSPGSPLSTTSRAADSAAATPPGANLEPEPARREQQVVNFMTSDFGTATAWETHPPKLGTWPNVEPGVGRPDVVPPPEPSIFVKERKMPIIGGVSDSDLIAEFDRIRGTADLNDNASWTSGL